MFASLSDSLNTNVTKVTFIYLPSPWGRNHGHQQTHKHTLVYLHNPVIDTSKTLVLFFLSFPFFRFHFLVNSFFVSVCLLPASLHRLFLSLSLLNNFVKHFIILTITGPTLFKETNHLSPLFEISPLSPQTSGSFINSCLKCVL